MPISNLTFALFLTIAVECLMVFVLGYRKKYQILIIVLANVITNPALNYILILFRMLGVYTGFSLMVLEVAIVLVEWRIMVYAFKAEYQKLFILSAVINSASYAAGVLTMGL